MYLIIVPTKFGALFRPRGGRNPGNIYIKTCVSAGKDLLSIPHAETRYRGDVIRQKRRQKTPFIFNGGNQK